MLKFSSKYSVYIFSILIITLLFVGYGVYAYYSLSEQTKETENELRVNIETLQETLTQKEQENAILTEAVEREKTRNDDLEERVEDAENVLGNIVKLQKTDRELLQKYSKVYFLNEHYQPGKMVKIDSEYVFKTNEEEYIHADVWPFLENLLEKASRSGINLQITSAFRSFDEQATLKAGYKVVYGSGANAFSADQGYSEHQLGTTVDFTTQELGADFSNIETAEAYKWLTDNAYKYGLTLSYPPNNAYYQYEPWHWRFVGTELAGDLHSDGKYFYDLDQRKIDEYLLNFFD